MKFYLRISLDFNISVLFPNVPLPAKHAVASKNLIQLPLGFTIGFTSRGDVWPLAHCMIIATRSTVGVFVKKEFRP
jgi:hypothetical protein